MTGTGSHSHFARSTVVQTCGSRAYSWWLQQRLFTYTGARLTSGIALELLLPTCLLASPTSRWAQPIRPAMPDLRAEAPWSGDGLSRRRATQGAHGPLTSLQHGTRGACKAPRDTTIRPSIVWTKIYRAKTVAAAIYTGPSIQHRGRAQ